jgi:PLP dependent protein
VIRDNIVKIRQRIDSACVRVNRDPREITIVAVTKGRSADQIKEALDSGLADIGENMVQEALGKYNAICAGQHAERMKWHLVGHLQTNKAREAVKIFSLIHSLDSRHLAEEINKQAAKINKLQDVLIEVNVSGEASKFGIKPEEAADFIKDISGFRGINIKGLMTIAPIAGNPENARPYFRILRELRDKIHRFGICDLGFGILSMGMTDDFEVAIEEGATMVRIGRAIFDQ